MKAFIGYLKEFVRVTGLAKILDITLLVGILITLNYAKGIEGRLFAFGPVGLRILAFYGFYLAVLIVSWGIVGVERFPKAAKPQWFIAMGLAPLYFACKMVHWDLDALVPSTVAAPWDHYLAVVLQLPCKLLLLAAIIWGWRRYDPEASFGLTRKDFRPKPYLLILAMVLPLIALASTQHDFLAVYPKVRNVSFLDGHVQPLWPWKLLYELSYGLDFLSIELFFRGWLVVCLARKLGARVILPMAAFYCTVHFGKPLGECISSFFGGLVLGVIAWRTRSILGGLMVHLGIAWLMEIGGWIGNGWF